MSTTPLLPRSEPHLSYGAASTSQPSPIPSRKGKRTALRSSLLDDDLIHDGWRRWTQRLGRGHRPTSEPAAVSIKPKKLVSSVFGQGGSATAPPLIHGANIQPTTAAEFEAIVASVKLAVAQGVQPVRIAKGSSGSYFARNEGKVCVAVFKPKDEEPYGRLNPKTLKWIHRTFFSWVGFGRSCLLPNLSYVSEVAASHLDRRLGLALVPRTELEAISSPAFFYDWIDRTAHVTQGVPLPAKVGSFQLFARGFTDASQWLREHPWPHGVAIDAPKAARSSRHHLRRCLRFAAGICGRAEADVFDDDDADDEATLAGDLERDAGRFRWTTELKDHFCDELQKLVALDYLMLNTDRGLDNFMIRYHSAASGSSLHKIFDRLPPPIPSPTTASHLPQHPNVSFQQREPHVTIAAIDNSLSFPWTHPNGWRTYAYGWLWLPVSLIGRPFGEQIRNHLIPLLSSPAWWEQTIDELRSLFELDPGFNATMFAHQVAVIKGQGLNLLRSLQEPDEGPLELCRRPKLEVWMDELELPDDNETERLVAQLSGPDNLPTSPPAVHVHIQPAQESAAQEALLASQAQETLQTDISVSSSPARPRPVSSSPQGTHWRSFQGVSGASVMKMLDKEAQRRGNKSSDIRSTSPKEHSKHSYDGQGDGLGDEDSQRQSRSDGEGPASSARRGRTEQTHSGRRRPPVFRSFSAGPNDYSFDAVGDDEDDAPTTLLKQDVVSEFRPPFPSPANRSHGRSSSSLSVGDREGYERPARDDGQRPSVTRIVLAERVKEIRSRGGWLRW